MAAVALFAATISPTRAQIPLSSPYDNPADLVREALAAPYGRAMVVEFGAVLRASADAACLRSKNLKPEQLETLGEAFLVKWGASSLRTLASFIDIALYETEFAKNAGAGAQTELDRLKADPDVKRYLAIERPRRRAAVVNYIVEQFTRYTLINRIMVGPVAPLASGNQALLDADPTEKVEADLEEFLASVSSEPLLRYLDISEKASAALETSLNTEQVRNSLGPSELFRGAEKDLAGLCIVSGNNPR